MARTRSAATARERRLSGVKRKKYAQDEFFSSVSLWNDDAEIWLCG
jgi:hypothetical protein